MSGPSEVAKLEKHLSLLREEYVKLQNRLSETERKYETLAAATGDENLPEKSFVGRLLRKVTDLFEKDLYSDITIHLEGHQLRGHRFVLFARSDNWGVQDLSSADHLEFPGISYSIGYTLLKWVYTDQLDTKLGDGFVVELMRGAKQFSLDSLIDRCEHLLISRLDVQNSVKLYQSAEELGAEKLRDKCLQLIMARWDDFTPEDFSSMSAPLLYKMLCNKSEYPLHSAIKLKREDIVFLYLIEFDSQLKSKLNERDQDGRTPLAIALDLKEGSIAKTLVSHSADINAKDSKGNTHLVSAIQQGNSFACKFLLDNNADVDLCESSTNRTPLHLLCAHSSSSCDNSDTFDGLLDTAERIVERTSDFNVKDIHGDSALHLAIRSKNEPMFHLLLNQSAKIEMNLRNNADETPLWTALVACGQSNDFGGAQKLVNKGADVNSVFSETGASLLHHCIDSAMETSAVFLLRNKASTSVLNRKGESALHLACLRGLKDLVKKLLTEGADPNVQTRTGDIPDMQTALHMASTNGDVELARIFVEHNRYCQQFSADSVTKPVNFGLVDSLGDTPFSCALWRKNFEVAKLLVPYSDVNAADKTGTSLLHRSITSNDASAALLLIENGADINLRPTGDQANAPLLEAVKAGMAQIVREMCKRGADLSIRDSSGNSALWLALETKNEDVASVLVECGCDRDAWLVGPTGCMETMLHRAIDSNDEYAACFLIRSMCDINALKKRGPNGGDEEAKEKQTPLHMAASWGLENVASLLVEMGAEVNAQDVEGKTPVHVAVVNQNLPILQTLLKSPSINLIVKDRKGLTPFATALNIKNGNKAAQLILEREPRAASQVDGKGYNFLHTAVKNADLESVLFLLSIHIDLNTPTNDADRFMPLHLAAATGHEMLVRNLLLAGAKISERTSTKQTALHIAAANDRPSICSILIENSIDFDAMDSGNNNALHIAVQRGSVACVRTLLTECRINAEAINVKGQTPIHVLGAYGKENAASIFDIFAETMPNYNFDSLDAEGNTMLLLAYTNGNAQLCRAACRVGACLGTTNSHGVSIFNYKTPTKQLLFRLLDHLTREPKWAEGDNCSECGVKFSLTIRKHHCRHCGRLLCGKCSDQEMPIIKYDLQKAVRVCDICFDVLTLGTQTE